MAEQRKRLALRTAAVTCAAREVCAGQRKVELVGGDWPDWGDATFRADDGWIFSVFSDGDAFDYFDWVEAPDGRRWDYDEAYVDSEGDPDDLAEFNELDELCGEIDTHHRAAWGIPS